MKRFGLLLGLYVAGVGCSAQEKDTAAQPTVSVNDLMIDVITPATNTLWAVEDPKSDTEWQELLDAALLVIDAAGKIRAGGTGPNDMEWSADPAWQAFTDTLTGAATAARDAAIGQDLDALLHANDVLYPPCEECHLQFHPGIAGEDIN